MMGTAGSTSLAHFGDQHVANVISKTDNIRPNRPALASSGRFRLFPSATDGLDWTFIKSVNPSRESAKAP